MTVDEVLDELKSLGSPSIKKVLLNHGAREPFFGVKVADLKKVQKRIKKDHQLALGLYATGNTDAMYLAGLIADEDKMTRKDLQRWVEGAYWHMLAGYTVPWVASESPHGWQLALEWIDSKKDHVAAAGWSTLGCMVAMKEDADLNLAELKKLLERVQKTIHLHPNRLGYAMNNFVIAVGSFVKPLTETAIDIGAKIGKVQVDMGDTECKVPYAPDYINKVKARGSIGKKRKTCKC